MQFALVLLALLPVSLARPQQRYLVEDIMDINVLRNTVQDLLDTLEPFPYDPNPPDTPTWTLANCEAECHRLTIGYGSSLMDTLCAPICNSFWVLVTTFNLRPQTTAAAADVAPVKRFLELPELPMTDPVQDFLDTLGPDTTQQECEWGCRDAIARSIQGDSSLQETFCTPFCRSFQALFATFNLRPRTTADPADFAPVKRLIEPSCASVYDCLGIPDYMSNVRNIVEDLMYTLGPDATEQACETECHSLVQGDYSMLCTPICRSYQTLFTIINFPLHPQTTLAPAKRQLVGGLDIEVVQNAVQDLLDVLGDSATEQQCEITCHSLYWGDQTALLHMFCTPICRSLLTLAITFNLRPPTTASPADVAPEKRQLLDNPFQACLTAFDCGIGGSDVELVKAKVQEMLDVLGPDYTEQQCENACHHLLQPQPETLCTPVCRSFQTLVHAFNLRPQTTAAPADVAPVKRLARLVGICQSIYDCGFMEPGLDLDFLLDTVRDLLDVLGPDATEQQCESACHSVTRPIVLGDETALLHQNLCTPICRSFQALVDTFNLRPQTTAAPA